ncbi:MAG TPA: hypothetical protein VHS28_10840 [Chloroflexota bacterium]|nr:hypothetical protein [Chloroflexota bacterium]
MNEYREPGFIDYDKLDTPLSRADLALLAIVLSFFAAIMATSLGNTSGLPDLLLRGFVTAVVTVGAIASLRGTILWGSTTEDAKRAIESARLSQRSHEIDLFHTQSRAI